MNCPICTATMPPRHSNGHLSVVCSNPCKSILRQWAQWMTQRGEPDDAAVDRLVHGERVDSSVSERIEATRQLTHWGRSVPFIAAHMHVTTRSVDRYRHEILLQEGV